MTGLLATGTMVGLLTAAAAAGQEPAQTPADINPIVMTINHQPVYAAEISLVMRNIAAQLEAQGHEIDRKQLLEVASQRVIEQKLLAQEARRYGHQPEEDRVAALMRAAEQQAGGRDALVRSLALGGADPTLLEQQYRELELGRVFINRQIRPTVNPDDGEVREFYDQHREQLRVDEAVHLRDLLIRLKEGADAGAERAALERARQARARALAGEEFARLAQELSQGPTAAAGGDLGFVTRAMIGAPLADAAFDLEPGEISDVIRTTEGFHLIKLEERQAAADLPLDQALAQARTLLVNQRIAERVAELLKTLTSRADLQLIDVVAPHAAPAAPASPETASPSGS